MSVVSKSKKNVFGKIDTPIEMLKLIKNILETNQRLMTSSLAVSH